jgi:type I restriction enzyme R subunit
LPTRELIAQFLAQVQPTQTHLLLIGCSAGWMLPTPWLQRFKRIDIYDIDPLVPFLFGLRHGRHLKALGIQVHHHRLDAIAKDLVWHFNERGYQGKAMFVALDKPTAVRMYDLVMKHWPDYVAELNKRIAQCQDQQEELKLRHHLKRVEETEVCVVVSSEQNEVAKFRAMGLEIEPHRKKMVECDLETEFKDDDNPFRLAIVCAMWITGFDVPCVSTVYLDKPIKGHTLMQTIARANRVYDDEKENGLIVDYGNVYRKLEEAYAVYGEGEN